MLRLEHEENPIFSRMLTLAIAREDRHVYWMCGIRLDGFGHCIDVNGDTEEEAIANAEWVLEKLNKKV